MKKKMLALLAGLALSLASCSPERPGSTPSTPQAEAKTKTIALAEKTAVEPPALPPPEKTKS